MNIIVFQMNIITQTRKTNDKKKELRNEEKIEGSQVNYEYIFDAEPSIFLAG